MVSSFGSTVGHVVLATAEALLQASIVALAGVYLARKGIMDKKGTKLLSAMSVNVTIPCLLFSQVLPSINFEVLGRAWPMLLLPFVYVGVGALVGWLATKLTNCADNFRAGMIASIAFGNATALPIVILSVISKQLQLVQQRVGADATDSLPSQMVVENPVVYVSIYLVTFPVLQFAVGGWLLRPAPPSARPSAAGAAMGGADGTPDAVHIELASANGAAQIELASAPRSQSVELRARSARLLDDAAEGRQSSGNLLAAVEGEQSGPASSLPTARLGHRGGDSRLFRLLRRVSPTAGAPRDALHECLQNGLVQQLLSPPVAAVLLGVVCSVLPPTYYLLCGPANVTSRVPSDACPTDTAILGPVTSAVRVLGDAAVPVQLILLGNMLSSGPDWGALPPRCCAAIVVAKMVVMPVFACALSLGLDRAFEGVLPVFADPYDKIFYVAAVALSATPTANTIVMLTELAGGNSQATATAIFAQYAAAPVLLTIVLSTAIVVLEAWG